MSDTTASPPVLELNGARATIRLNRPKHLNRLQADDLDVLLDLFGRIEADAAVRVVVLTGTGRAFSAGYDLNSVAERAVSVAEQRSAGSAFEMMVNRLEDLGVPTICRLNGGVYGGSTDLALACDFRIGVDTCEMFMPAARLGLHYYKSGIVRYVTRLGVDNAKRLFLTAERISAAEMLRIGYLTAVVPAEALDETELREILGDAIARLPEREKLVITLYYYEELTLREIGEVLGVTESRISQLHTKAILRLKARLAGAVAKA